MNGKDLRKCIQNSGKQIAYIAEKSGIKEATIYSLYRKEEVPQHYLDKIKLAEVSLDKTINYSVTDGHVSATEAALLRKIIDNLEDEVQFLRYLVSHDSKLSFNKKGDVSKNKDAKQHG